MPVFCVTIKRGSDLCDACNLCLWSLTLHKRNNTLWTGSSFSQKQKNTTKSHGLEQMEVGPGGFACVPYQKQLDESSKAQWAHGLAVARSSFRNSCHKSKPSQCHNLLGSIHSEGNEKKPVARSIRPAAPVFLQPQKRSVRHREGTQLPGKKV